MGMLFVVHPKKLVHVRISLDCESAWTAGAIQWHVALPFRVFPFVDFDSASPLTCTDELMPFSPGASWFGMPDLLAPQFNCLWYLFTFAPGFEVFPWFPAQLIVPGISIMIKAANSRPLRMCCCDLEGDGRHCSFVHHPCDSCVLSTLKPYYLLGNISCDGSLQSCQLTDFELTNKRLKKAKYYLLSTKSCVIYVVWLNSSRSCWHWLCCEMTCWDHHVKWSHYWIIFL